MRPITPELTPELLKHFKDKSKVASQPGFYIKNFRELVEQTAKLSYLNKDYLLFYRGQVHDHQNKSDSSSFYPSIYRRDHLLQREILYQFDLLEGACKSL